jgi:hypothetical protein
MRITSTQIDVKEPFHVLDLELEQMCGIMIWELLSLDPVRFRSIDHPSENPDQTSFTRSVDYRGGMIPLSAIHRFDPLCSKIKRLLLPSNSGLASYCRISLPHSHQLPLKTFDPTRSVINFTAMSNFVCRSIDLRVRLQSRKNGHRRAATFSILRFVPWTFHATPGNLFSNIWSGSVNTDPATWARHPRCPPAFGGDAVSIQ